MPGSLGVLLWALVHLLNLGEARAVVVFAGLAVMTLIALVKNLGWPARLSRRRLAAVRRDRERTADLPLARDRLVAARLALLVYASLLHCTRSSSAATRWLASDSLA